MNEDEIDKIVNSLREIREEITLFLEKGNEKEISKANTDIG